MTTSDHKKIINNAVLAFTVTIYDLDLPTALACLKIVQGYNQGNCNASNLWMKDALIKFLEDRIYSLEENISNHLKPHTA